VGIMQLNQTIDKINDYEFLRTILTNLPAVAFVIAPDGTILFAEGKSIALAGLRRDDIVGANTSKYFSQYPGLEDKVRRAFEGETVTLTVIGPSQRSLEVACSPMRDNRGSICGVIGVAQDITERIEQEQALRESEEKFRNITSTAIDAIIMMDQTGRISIWNDAAQVIFGYTEQEVIGQNFYLLITPQWYRDQCKMESIASLGEGHLTGKTAELIAKRKSGEEFPIELSLSAFRLHDRWYAIGTARDITERKQKEEALRASEERFSALFDEAPLGYQSLDEEGHFIEVNQAWLETLGYSREEVIGKWFGEFLAPEFVNAFRERFPQFKAAGKIHSEFQMLHKNGSRRFIAFEGRVGYGHDGCFKQTHCILSDITERKQAEDALQVAERDKSIQNEILRIFLTAPEEEMFGEVLAVVLQNLESHYGIFAYLDENGDAVAPSLTRDIWDKCEVPGKSIRFPRNSWTDSTWAKAVLDKRSLIKNEVSHVPQGHVPIENMLAVPILFKNEVIAYFEVANKPNGYGKAEQQWLERIADSIAPVLHARLERDRREKERKQAEEALRESEEKFRRIFDEGPLGMTMAGEDFRFMRVNAAFCRMVGYSASELTSLTFKDITHPDHLSEDSEFVKQVFNGEIPRYHTEKRYVRKDKETIWGALTLSAIRSNDGQFLYFLTMIEDITERKRALEGKERLQRQLQQSQKLEAIGTMAGGIAHDFNNILTGILGFTELVRSEIPEGTEVYENLTEVVKAGRRARDLVRQILSFSRKAETEKSLINLATTVKEALKLIRSVTPSHITIRQNFAVSAERSVLADPTQMHQIIMNLCLNAADAMPDGGVLEISLEEVRVETENRSEQIQLPSGCYLKLTVRDNGVGMPPEVQERIFEPYYTTKQVGKGTGMGMAVVHGVVKKHGGNIAVSSEPGRGTTVSVYLPVVESAPDTQIISAPVITTGSESILFVDDETMITNLQRSQLGRWGYRVTATESSATALNMFRANPQGFDLVITDLTMPGITGIKLAQAIHEISPSTPIILCTGFDEGILRENAEMIGIRAILTKPITGAEFSRMIRMVLNGAFKPSPAKS